MLHEVDRSTFIGPSVAIVGAGNLGSGLALRLHAAGYRITEILSRDRNSSRQKARVLARKVGAKAGRVEDGRFSATVVWLCVPDREIVASAQWLAEANWSRKIALHSSGALTSDDLALLRKQGARVASVHPMMTFVAGVTPSLRGVGFALEGDREAVQVASRIVAALGGEAFLISKKNKALYHAWGTFLSPLYTCLLALSEDVALAAGVPRPKVRRWAIPIVRQTFENYVAQGSAKGFSGPIVRGDIDTVKRHLQALESTSAARRVYAALARAAIEYLPTKNKAGLQRVIERALRG